MPDERVHAVDEGGRNRLCIGRVAPPLGLHVAAVTDQARNTVPFDHRGAEDFGQLTRACAAPDLHLIQAVLRRDETLGEEQVLHRLRIDVRDAPAVAEHLNGLAQAIEPNGALDLRQPGAGQLA